MNLERTVLDSSGTCQGEGLKLSHSTLKHCKGHTAEECGVRARRKMFLDLCNQALPLH